MGAVHLDTPETLQAAMPADPPAFPAIYPRAAHAGMSLREHYAGQALVGLLASGAILQWTDAGVADLAHNYADAMMVERARRIEAERKL